MKPEDKWTKEQLEEVRKFRLVEQALACPAPGLLGAISILEHMPDTLDITFSILDFDPFNALSDDLLSKPPTKEPLDEKKAARKWDRQDVSNSKSARAIEPPVRGPSAARSLEPSLPKPLGPVTRIHRSGPDKGKPDFTPPPLFSFKQLGNTSSLSKRAQPSVSSDPSITSRNQNQHDRPVISKNSLSSSTGITGDIESYKSQVGGRPSTLVKGGLHHSKQHASQKTNRSSTPVGALQRVGLNEPKLSAEHGISPTTEETMPSADAKIDVDFDIGTSAPKDHDSPQATDILMTIRLIDHLADALIAPSIEEANSVLPSAGIFPFGIGSDTLATEVAKIFSTKATKTVTELKQRSLESLDSRNRLAVFFIDSLADSILSHHATDEVSRNLLGRNSSSHVPTSYSEPSRQRDMSRSFSKLEASRKGAGGAKSEAASHDKMTPFLEDERFIPKKAIPYASLNRPDANRVVDSQDSLNPFESSGIALANSLSDSILAWSKENKALQITKTDTASSDTTPTSELAKTTSSSPASMTGPRAAQPSSRPLESSQSHEIDFSQNTKAISPDYNNHHDDESLETLLNDILVRQARRHGVDLS